MTDSMAPPPRPQNWAETFEFSADRVHHPRTVDELGELVSGADRIKAFGSRHSFHPLADSPTDLISLDSLGGIPVIAPDRTAVTVPGGATYNAVADVLEPAGLALANLASLPHISVAGACATATHGSGNGNPNLAAAVRGLELVCADGSLLTMTRDDPGFEGAVVGLGALGVLTSLTLDVQPCFEVSQTVYEDLPLATAIAEFEAISDVGYSVSLFTDWRSSMINLLWVKSLTRLTADELFGARRAGVERSPVPGASPANTTPQLGVPGPWSQRLAHFRAEFTPSTGAEVQSEYLLPREHAGSALAALALIADQIAPLLQTCEVRTVAADELWLSTAYRQDSVALHFTWLRRPADVAALLPTVEAALAPLHPRPHWGKAFTLAPPVVQAGYPRLADFRELARGLDPGRKFGNHFLDEYIY